MDFLKIMAIGIPIIVLLIFVFVAAMIFSPKLRATFTKRQLRATKSMLEDMKDELTDMAVTMSSVAVETEKGILDKNEDTLKSNARRRANIDKEGIEVRTRAVKDGLVKDAKYCKHCGESIDADSKFCKSCGKEQ